MKAWRLAKTRYAPTAFDGEGARLNGGRWSSAGTAVVYTSDSLALATLDLVVNLMSGMPLAYSSIMATIPDEMIEHLDVRTLPREWNTFPAPPAVQAIGDAWVRSGRSLALRVPSAIAADSWNVLINPKHSDFRHVEICDPNPYDFDPRLIK